MDTYRQSIERVVGKVYEKLRVRAVGSTPPHTGHNSRSPVFSWGINPWLIDFADYFLGHSKRTVTIGGKEKGKPNMNFFDRISIFHALVITGVLAFLLGNAASAAEGLQAGTISSRADMVSGGEA